MDAFMFEFSTGQWIILFASALLIGVSKTGVPGIGILVVPLMAEMFDAKLSTGMVLPMLAFADLFAVAYYRRHAVWSHVLKLLPWALVGIGTGSLVIGCISDAQLKLMIGFIVLAMLGLSFWRNFRKVKTIDIPTHWAFAAVLGFAAGLTTQLANAAGPIMVIYLLAMRLDKNEFIGTGAWYFLILNWLKIPLFIFDGRIGIESIKADLIVLPIIAIGAFAGIFLLKCLPQKWFNIVVQVLAVLAAFKLVASALSFFK